MRVDLLFFTPPGLPLDGGTKLAGLVAEITREIHPSSVLIESWDIVSYADVSVQDYVATEQLYLDWYSYGGKDPPTPGLPRPPG